MRRGRRSPQRFYFLLGVLALGVLLATAGSAAFACDTDDDCGPGATCIKREKRARGVCYGRANGADPAAAQPPAALPRPVEGVRRERAIRFFGDPDQTIKDQLPGKETGAVCMVNQDCPTGSECVIAGFEGRCVRF